MPIDLQNTFTDGPTSGSCSVLLSVDQLECLSTGSLAVFRDFIRRALAVCRGSVLRILPALPSMSGFDTAGTAYTRGSLLMLTVHY